MLSVVAQVTDVRCVNCGADTWTEVAAVATFIGLAIAVAAFFVSLKAANSADESLRITREQFDIAKDEHDEFLRQLTARAELEVQLDPGAEPSNGYIRLASATNLRARLTVRNVGNKGAGRTHVEVYMPVFVNDTQFGWTNAAGSPLDGKPFSQQSGRDPRVKLDDGEGQVHETRRLPLEIDDVPPNVPAEFALQLPVPDAPRGLVIPYRIRVRAQHMTSEVNVDGAVRIARPDTLGGV